MPVYVMLSQLTDEGRKTLKKNPNRIREVNDEVEAMGAKILAQYALIGPYDFCTILEVHDNEIMAGIAVELGSRGTMQPLTLPALTIDELISGIRKG